MLPVIRILPARPEAVWDVLVDTTAWPLWGPSVRGVELDGGGTRIGPGTTGRVATAVGVTLPFEVTSWEEGRSWAWRVAGVAATSHAVDPEGDDPGTARAMIAIPTWAPFYAPVCWVALERIGLLAART